MNWPKSNIVKLLTLTSFWVLVALIFMTACAGAEDAADSAHNDMDRAVPDKGAEFTLADAQEDAGYRAISAEIDRQNSEQKLILNGNLEITVDDANKARSDIRTYLENVGGYIENSSFRTTHENSVWGHITVRVPQDAFDESMDYFEQLGKVVSRDTSSDDVTMEYVDMEARINNLERQESRYLDILGEANTVEDIMTVEEKLKETREQIETMTARLEQLKGQVSYSTIEIAINEEKPVVAKVKADGFDGLWERMSSAFTTSINNVITGATNLLVLLSGFLPYLPVVVIVAALIYKLRGKLNFKRGKSEY